MMSILNLYHFCTWKFVIVSYAKDERNVIEDIVKFNKNVTGMPVYIFVVAELAILS